MKTKVITTILSLAFLLVIVSKSYSETYENLSVSSTTPGVVLMKFAGSPTNASRLYILDKDKNIVYSEVLRNKVGIAKLYNITALPEGEYFFKLISKEGTVIKSVVYSNTSKTEVKPLNVGLKTSTLPGKLNLTCTGVNDNDVSINIYDGNKELIYSENVDVRMNFSKTYDLTQIQEDNFTFTVTSAGRTVTKEVDLNSPTLSLN